MVAPTRRAAPVTSTVLPRRVSGRAAASGVSCAIEPDYDGIGAALNPAAAHGRRAGAQPVPRRAYPRGARKCGRLAVVRAFHGAGAVRAGTRLLQRREREAGLRRRFRYRTGSLRPLLTLHRAPVRR